MKKPILLFILVFAFLLMPAQKGLCDAGEITLTRNVQNHKKPEVMLILDNSGSMIKNDPDFLLRSVVKEFLTDFKIDWRIGMVIFDQGVRLAEPLTEMANQDSRLQFTKSIEKINYKGLLSDTPGAVERAIYELKIKGRKNAPKIIVLLTDGIVDTGNKQKDIAREKWLKENLTAMSKKEGIRIFGIAFTDQADFSLIQTLAQKTKGEYFRAQKAEDIGQIVDIIDKMINQLLLGPEPAKPEITAEKPPKPVSQEVPVLDKPVAPGSADQGETIETPLIKKTTGLEHPKPVPYESNAGSIYRILTGIIIILLIVIIIIILNGKTVEKKTEPEQPVVSEKRPPTIPRAELIDIKNVTGHKTLILNKGLITIGRDKDNDISIPEETVSSFHATIEFRGGFFFLEDQRSKNKTYLSGHEIGASTPVKLKSGDDIRFNTHKFIFILPHLIPAGKTVVDFTGKKQPPDVDKTIVKPVPTPLPGAVTFPRTMLIDAKNITGKKTFTLEEKTTKIGRDVHNTISIPETTISGFHATIEYKDGAFFIEDQRSRNKTFLNGDEMDSHSPKKLKSGDEIKFFTHKFIFLIERQLPTGDTGDRQ